MVAHLSHRREHHFIYQLSCNPISGQPHCLSFTLLSTGIEVHKFGSFIVNASKLMADIMRAE
jgi:hypothetical protein